MNFTYYLELQKSAAEANPWAHGKYFLILASTAYVTWLIAQERQLGFEISCWILQVYFLSLGSPDKIVKAGLSTWLNGKLPTTIYSVTLAKAPWSWELVGGY